MICYACINSWLPHTACSILKTFNSVICNIFQARRSQKFSSSLLCHLHRNGPTSESQVMRCVGALIVCQKPPL